VQFADCGGVDGAAVDEAGVLQLVGDGGGGADGEAAGGCVAGGIVNAGDEGDGDADGCETAPEVPAAAHERAPARSAAQAATSPHWGRRDGQWMSELCSAAARSAAS